MNGSGPEEVVAGAVIFMTMILALLPLLMFVFLLFSQAFWIWMIVDCAKNRGLTDNDRIVWILVVVLVNWLGAAVYFFAGRPKRNIPIEHAENSQRELPPPLPPPTLST